MKYLSLKIKSCADECPYMDEFYWPDADGWCVKYDNEIPDRNVIPDFCKLDDYLTERECRRASRT